MGGIRSPDSALPSRLIPPVHSPTDRPSVGAVAWSRQGTPLSAWFLHFLQVIAAKPREQRWENERGHWRQSIPGSIQLARRSRARISLPHRASSSRHGDRDLIFRQYLDFRASPPTILSGRDRAPVGPARLQGCCGTIFYRPYPRSSAGRRPVPPITNRHGHKNPRTSDANPHGTATHTNTLHANTGPDLPGRQYSR